MNTVGQAALLPEVCDVLAVQSRVVIHCLAENLNTCNVRYRFVRTRTSTREHAYAP